LNVFLLMLLWTIVFLYSICVLWMIVFSSFHCSCELIRSLFSIFSFVNCFDYLVMPCFLELLCICVVFNMLKEFVPSDFQATSTLTKETSSKSLKACMLSWWYPSHQLLVCKGNEFPYILALSLAYFHYFVISTWDNKHLRFIESWQKFNYVFPIFASLKIYV
jgi:hypothetical protein